MVISAEPLVYLLIFVAVLILIEGIYLTVFGKSISLLLEPGRIPAAVVSNDAVA